MAKLNEESLQRMIKGGETSTVELKVASPRPTEMAERLCGMANGQGGIIIIGVEDTEKRIVGIPDERMALTIDVTLRAARQIQPMLVLDPPEPEIYTLDSKQVVVVTVPPNRGPLYQASGVCWIRRGTYTVPLSVSEMLELANDRGLVKWELQPARKATLKDIDLARVAAYLKQRAVEGYYNSRFEDVEQALAGMDCAIVTGNGELVPTNAGILFFGSDPQLYLMQSEVVCVLFHDELGVGGYVDRKIIRGTMKELIDGTEEFLHKYVAVGAKIEGWKRIDLPEYPLEALREAVVNAVVHRDYSRDGESIRVFYYRDRIEIHSPGLLLPGISVEQMSRGEVTSKLRNPVLANLLRDVPGYMERMGSGVRFMLNETKRMGLPTPEFREMSEFVVTFRKAIESEQEVIVPQRLFPDEYGQTIVPQTKEDMISDQKRRFALAMRYVQEHGSITNGEYRQLTGVSINTALRDLEVLVSRGSLKIVGKRRGRRYELP
jgi:predicted HTH transcriptional regulator